MTIQIADSRGPILGVACYEGNPGAMRKILQRRTLSISRVAVLVLCLARLAPLAIAHAQFKDCQASQGELTLSRNAQNWQFLDAVGPHSALLGREDGNFEAWIYPLKLLRDFHLTFHLGGHVIPGETLPRTITVAAGINFHPLRVRLLLCVRDVVRSAPRHRGRRDAAT